MGAKSSSHEKTSPSKIEQRIVGELAARAQRGQDTHKTFNSIILKFPQIDRSFEGVREVFKKFDLNGSGTIDLQELKKCFRDLQVNVTDEELTAFYEESDLYGKEEISFKEFIVLLALVYFLGCPVKGNSSKSVPSRLGLPQLEKTFETIVDAFIFLDGNGDGYLSKSELTDSINGLSPTRHGGRLAGTRFDEMDWDNNGLVTFKEFLFVFTNWVGLEENSDDES